LSGQDDRLAAPIDIKSPGKWTVHAAGATARQEVAVAELNGRIFGSAGGRLLGTVAAVEVYDPRPELGSACATAGRDPPRRRRR